MRILLLVNNWLGWQVLEWLCTDGDEIVGLVLHPNGHRKYGEEIVRTAQIDPSCIFDGSQLTETSVLASIQALKPDIGLSVLFGHILHRSFLDLLPAGCLNVHPAYLPYNRGAYPNVWSIIDKTPAGVTIHYIDDGVDTGDIIAQKQVPVEPVDTGESLYHKLEYAALDLFKETWALVRSKQISRTSQKQQQGTCHRVRDVQQLDNIELMRTYTGGELIDIIRSRTFSDYPGAYFMYEGKKVYLRLQLFYEEKLK
jgi:methionyl-tRNA formyltransferase